MHYIDYWDNYFVIYLISNCIRRKNSGHLRIGQNIMYHHHPMDYFLEFDCNFKIELVQTRSKYIYLEFKLDVLVSCGTRNNNFFGN